LVGAFVIVELVRQEVAPMPGYLTRDRLAVLAAFVAPLAVAGAGAPGTSTGSIAPRRR
jgi:hypothetical protein